MKQPLVVNLPHKLGAEEARRRIAGGVGKLESYIPGGGSEVTSSWSGDRLNLLVKAMGQEVTSHIDVQEANVRVEVMLPPMLSMFAGKISRFLGSRGSEMLEDKSKK